MAITKEGTISGPVSKPRRGVSPSCNGSSGSRTVPIGTRRSPSPSLSEKPAPSYLRPTVSSHDEVKKKVLSSPNNAAKKPVLIRRSSLDRPPAASHLQKIISSTPRERSVTVRSSSFSGRSGMSYRPVSEKATTAPSKTAKAMSRTTHPGNNIGGKAVAKKSVTKKKESSDNTSTAVDDASGNGNSGMSSVPEGDILSSITREKMAEVGKMVAVAEEENAAIVQEESEVVMEDHHHAAHPENEVMVKEEVVPEEVVVSEGEEDDKNLTASVQVQMEEIVSDQASNSIAAAASEVEDKEEREHIVENDVDAKEEKEVRDIVEMVANSEVEMSAKEKQSKEKENGEETRVVAKPSDNVVTVTPARKDPAQANNDVIEETAKKLMESRKNKVRALAGAFETVISLEKPNQA